MTEKHSSGGVIPWGLWTPAVRSVCETNGVKPNSVGVSALCKGGGTSNICAPQLTPMASGEHDSWYLGVIDHRLQYRYSRNSADEEVGYFP